MGVVYNYRDKGSLRDLTGAESEVWRVLMRHADAHGVCYPQVTKMQALTNRSNKTVRRALNKLRTVNMIRDVDFPFRQHMKRARHIEADRNVYQLTGVVLTPEGWESVLFYPFSVRADVEDTLLGVFFNGVDLTPEGWRNLVKDYDGLRDE